MNEENQGDLFGVGQEETQKVQSAINEALTFFKSGKLAEAQKVLSHSMAFVEKSPPAFGFALLQKLCSVDYLRGDKASLVQHLKALGTFLMSSKQFKQAANVFDTTLAFEPDNKEIIFLNAKNTILSGDLPLGVPQLKKVIDCDPTNIEAFALLVKSSASYRPEGALQYVNGYLRLQPDSFDAHNDVVRIYEQLGIQTEAVTLRIKMSALTKDEKQLQEHLSESAKLYPNEPEFHRKMLEIAIASADWEKTDTELANLSRIFKKSADLRQALIFSEMRLAIDPKSEELREEVAAIRKQLGLIDSPLVFQEAPLPWLESTKRCLLTLDFQPYFDKCSKSVQEALLSGDIETAKNVRLEWLSVQEFKGVLEERFEGNHSATDDVWAKLMTASTFEQLKPLKDAHPKLLPVLEKILVASRDDVSRLVEIWLDEAQSSVNTVDFEATKVYISLLAQTLPSLAPFLPKIRPILLATVR